MLGKPTGIKKWLSEIVLRNMDMEKTGESAGGSLPCCRLIIYQLCRGTERRGAVGFYQICKSIDIVD